MERAVPRPTRQSATLFLLGLVLLCAIASALAELRVRAGHDSAFQALFHAEQSRVDWLVLGASHALPLAFGDVPGRLERETGQSMAVLAEIGAGPLYARFIAGQALGDLGPKRVLYVLDDFALLSGDWNTERVADRGLLRTTPLRPATARTLAGMVWSDGVDPAALADYLAGFSRLNPPDRFPTAGWQGAAGFDRAFRPSRHAVQSRVEYLFPDPQGNFTPHLASLETLIAEARAAGAEMTLIRPPLPEVFRTALPDTAPLAAALAEMAARLGVPLHDFSAVLDDPRFYFDTDHLNRDGVEVFYRDHLAPVLAARP